MSDQYPPQPPYNNQPNGNDPQYPYNPQQPPPYGQPPTQYPNQSYPPGYIPAFPQPAQNTQYPMQPPIQPGQYPQPQQPQKKKRKSVKETWNSGNAGKCGIIFACGVLLLVVFACAGAMNAASGTGSPVATPQTANQNVPADTPLPTDTPVPTVKPTPTPKPKPTAKPTPTQSPAQLEAAYKASTTDTTVAALDKDGNADSGNEEHFTSTIIGFVKDSSGNTAGANVSDAATSSVVQVEFTPGTDVTQLNEGDTLEVWGSNQGVSSGTNAFGGTVQEVVIQANYLADTTTGYKADS